MKRKFWIQRHRGKRWPLKKVAEIRVTLSQVQEYLGLRETGTKKDFSPEPLEGEWLGLQFDSICLASRTESKF